VFGVWFDGHLFAEQLDGPVFECFDLVHSLPVSENDQNLVCGQSRVQLHDPIAHLVFQFVHELFLVPLRHCTLQNTLVFFVFYFRDGLFAPNRHYYHWFVVTNLWILQREVQFTQSLLDPCLFKL